MMWTQWKVWACVLAALGLAVGGAAIAFQNAPAQSPPIEPGVKQVALEPKESQPAPPKDGREAELEALKKEIEALRKKVDAFGKKEEQHKIVATSPQAKDIVITQRYVGTIRSQRHINVRALANGYLDRIFVKEGQAVKKGDVMFTIYPVLYQAKYEAAKAEFERAELEYNYTKSLSEKKAVSQVEVAQVRAKTLATKAKLELAKAELDFCNIRAPFDGIVDRLREREGSLITEREIFTTLSDNSVIWVYFNVPEASYLEYMAGQSPDKDVLRIELVLANGSKFPQTGKIGAIEADFNNRTGSIPFRADFPNPHRLLRHGQTGNVLIHRPLKNALVIPRRATFEVLDKRYVWVVGKDDVVHQREIVIQHAMEDAFVIKKGLDVNDRIVLEGVRQVHDGDKVKYEFRKPEEVMTNPKSPGEK